MVSEEFIVQEEGSSCDYCEHDFQKGERVILEDDLMYHRKCFDLLKDDEDINIIDGDDEEDDDMDDEEFDDDEWEEDEEEY